MRTMDDAYQIEPFRPAQLPAAIALSSAAGWNQLESDWRRVVEYQPDGCFVAVQRTGQRESLVGTVSSTCYGKRLAWIGMMLVDSAHRRRGIGEALMRRVLSWLDEQQVECVKLDATPLGEPLYRRLGFEPEWSFHRWRLDLEPPSGLDLGNAAEPTAAGLSEPLLRLDREAFGADRGGFLKRLASESHGVTESDRGLLFARAGRLATYLGPLIARDAATAESLLDQWLRDPLPRSASGALFWDIPGPNVEAARLAAKYGFQPVRDLTRMRLPGAASPGRLHWQYAIAGPAVG